MNIAIIGVGLIGGSIGLTLKKLKVKGEKLNVIGIGRNIKRLNLAKKLGAVDEITTDIKSGVKDADIIFICLPIGLIAKTVKKIIPFCKKTAIITDVGSVKTPIVTDVEKFYTEHSSFIGGHPIAGAEKTSVKFASQDLFRNAVIVLTPTRKVKKQAISTLKNLWRKMGGKVDVMSHQEHDSILSETSHLPHVIAFALVNSVDNVKYTGSGFRDITRIASSDPHMWAEIIYNNRTNVRTAIRKFKKELSKIESARTIKELTKIFRRAKEKRDALLQMSGIK